MDTNQTANVGIAGGISNALAETGHFLLNFLAFLAILIVGYFVATYLGKIVTQLLTKVGFDRAVERSGIKKAIEASGFHPSLVLGKLAFYTVFLFVLQLAFGVFGPNPISDLLTRVIAFLPNVFVAIVIVVLSASIASGVKDFVRAAIGGLSYGVFLSNLASAAIILVGGFAALNQLDIAPAIVNGLFYAILAIIVGVSVVAIGGAGIVPLRSRWETGLSALENEFPKARAQVSGSQIPQTPRPIGEPPVA